MHTRFLAVGAAAIAMAIMGTATPGAAAPAGLSESAFTIVGGPAPVPIGAFEFCRANRGECGPNSDPESIAALSRARWNELVAINAAVNADVLPETDEVQYHRAEYWTYPDGAGDCEDFAHEKRREQIRAGWNPSTLLMTVVRQADGEGHAVLTVRTDRGDLILDNQDDRVLVWSATPYQYLKRQSQLNSSQWVSLLDDHEVTVASGPAGITAGQ
jgi:predicted transglutaminase-like cysteine proteinase